MKTNFVMMITAPSVSITADVFLPPKSDSGDRLPIFRKIVFSIERE